MKFASLVRELALIRAPERQVELARLSHAQLGRLPEATIVTVVHGWFELKADGHPDADILREIEGRRKKEYGEESLPGDLTLESYARYRLRLEHPREEKAHDAIFVMQAVHRARQVLGATYREDTEGTTARGARPGAMAILAYAVLIGVIQGSLGFIAAFGSRAAPVSPGAALVVALVAVFLLLGAIGYAGGTVWGRPTLQAGLWGELAVLAIAEAQVAVSAKGSPGGLVPLLVPAAGAIAALYYLHRRHREFTAPLRS
ncbi:MAG: hypothetical protein IPL06_04875 [Betaproteobacteria bacterium]|nr:hypothetical protein [Betaproteobacteria bacterium]